MAQNKLILRKLDSGFGVPFQDAIKGSVLSHAELDGNQIYLKGELIYTAQTANSGSTLILPQIKGTQFEVDLNPVVANADVTITGMTFDDMSYLLTLYRNDGTTYQENLAALASDVFVGSGEYNPDDGTIDFTFNSGGTFSVSGFTTGMTNYYTTTAYTVGNIIKFDRTDTNEAYEVDVTPILSGALSSIIYTNPEPMPADVGGWEEGSTFSALTMQEMWDGLLYPYQYPSIDLTGAVFKTYEVGEFLPTGATLNYTVDNSVNIKSQPPNVGDPSTNVAGATFPIDPFELLAAGTFDIEFAASTTLTAPGSRTITITGTNTRDETFSDTETMLWRHKRYWGNYDPGACPATDLYIGGVLNGSFVPPNDTQIILVVLLSQLVDIIYSLLGRHRLVHHPLKLMV
jgi:hypothetical protein